MRLGPKEQVSVDTSDKTVQIGKIKLIPGTDSYPHRSTLVGTMASGETFATFIFE